MSYRLPYNKCQRIGGEASGARVGLTNIVNGYKWKTILGGGGKLSADRQKPVVVPAMVYLLGGLLIVLACVAWFVGRTEARPEHAVIATVDGEPVTEEEFRWALARERSGVIEQNNRMNGAVVDETFWLREADGMTLLETIKRRALDSVVRMKVQLQLAEQYGLMADGSFGGLLLEMKRENASRAKAIAAGLPVYGPTRFDQADFIDFYLARLTIELKDKLAETELGLTEERLKQHYGEIKDELFRLEGVTRFYAISAAYRIDGVIDDERKRTAASAIGEIRERLAAGEALTTLVDELGIGASEAGENSMLQAAENTFDALSARYYYRALPQLYELLANAPEPGFAGPILDDEANGQYMLPVVIDSKAGGYASYEERRDIVRQHYLESRYEEYVSRMSEEAHVVLMNEEYDRITMKERRG